MSIKNSKYSNAKQALNVLKSMLSQSLNLPYLPKEIIQKINDLTNEVEKFDLSSYKNAATKLTGSIHTLEEVLKIIQEETGYTKWESVNPFEEYDDYKFNPDDLKEDFDVDFSSEDVKQYLFDRDVHGRDDIRFITVTVLPGYFFASYDTRRANFSSDNLLNLVEFKKELNAHF